MEGDVTSYSGTTLVINVDNYKGSGTYGSWYLNNVGLLGQTLSHDITLLSGGVFRSAASGTRIQIDKYYIAGYNSSDEKQFYVSALDGNAYFGDGLGSFTSDGVNLVAPATENTKTQIKWKDGSLSGTTLAALAAENVSGTYTARMVAGGNSVAANSEAKIEARSTSSYSPKISLIAKRDAQTYLALEYTSGGTKRLTTDARVGINETSPDCALHVKSEGTGGAFKVNSSANANILLFEQGSSGGGKLSVRNSSQDTQVCLDGDGTGQTSWIAGKLAVGENSIDNGQFEVLGPSSGAAASVKINATTANITASNRFFTFRSTDGEIGAIQGTASPGVIAYNTFTGSHFTSVSEEDFEDLVPNILLEIVDGGVDPSIGGEHLFRTRICRTRASKAAVGVWGGRDENGKDLVLSIGTGWVWVSNQGEDLEIGDYVCSSDVAGCVEKQWDNLYRAETVAKVTQPVVWQPGEEKRLVGCIYLGG